MTQEEFNHTLCTYLRRPYFLKLPAIVVKVLFGKKEIAYRAIILLKQMEMLHQDQVTQ